MKIEIEQYVEAVKRFPQEGQHILAHQSDDMIVVYQAYNPAIANYAVANQHFGGASYSYNRMSWIKPNFLWMMYRCGWASKENQERVLALWINKTDLDKILQQAVPSTFDRRQYSSHDEWKANLKQKDVRLQWDPDHDPYGTKLTRRAIQIGMKGETLDNFGKKQVKLIEDITEFVKEQAALVDIRKIENLLVPVENIYKPQSKQLQKTIGTD